ncbi:hypothetical protein EJB05_56796, partial [Eragrostis curvula]
MARRAAGKGRWRPRKPSPSSAAAGDGSGSAEDARPQAPRKGSGGGGFFCCYLLRSQCPRLKGRTYIGFTVNPRRRIRQHNGEISSGAWKTRRGRPWEMLLCIHGFPTNVAALQFEWAWQNPKESLAVRQAAAGFKSLSGAGNKVRLAYAMLNLPSWEKLNLTVNFFSSASAKFAAGCPPLPTQMKTVVCPLEDLQCHAEAVRDDQCLSSEDQATSSEGENMNNDPQGHHKPPDLPRRVHGSNHPWKQQSTDQVQAVDVNEYDDSSDEFAPIEWDGILDLTEPDGSRTSPQYSFSSDGNDDRVVKDKQASTAPEEENTNNNPQDHHKPPDSPRRVHCSNHPWKQQSTDQVQAVGAQAGIAVFDVNEYDDYSDEFAPMEWDGILDLTEPDGSRTSPQCSLSSDGDDEGVVDDEFGQASAVWKVCVDSDGGDGGVVDDELGHAFPTPMLKTGADSDCGDSGVTNAELGQVSPMLMVDAGSDEVERDEVVDLVTPIPVSQLGRRPGAGCICPRIIDLTASPVVIEL